MFGLSVVSLLKCIRNDHCFKVIRKSINSFVFSGRYFRYQILLIMDLILEPWVHQRMKHGPVLYLYRNSNHPFHDGNKVVIYLPSSTIECGTMHWIYFSFVQNLFFLWFLILSCFWIENARLWSSTTYISKTMPCSSLFQTIRSTKFTCTGSRCCTCGQRRSQVIEYTYMYRLLRQIFFFLSFFPNWYMFLYFSTKQILSFFSLSSMSSI